jgi:ribosomal-protein-alanine N-acetyltransferase
LSELLVRKAFWTDLDKLVEMERICFPQGDAFSKRAMRRMVINPNGSIILDVLEYGGCMAGYAAYLTRKNSRTIRLYSLCVLPDYEGRGLARKYLEGRLKDFSPYFSRISLEVRTSNGKAVRLYQGLGFKLQKVLEKYYADGEKGYRLVKLL